MQNQILALAQQLIALETIPEKPEQLKRALDIVLDELQDFTVERFECNGVHSALVYNAPTRPERFRVVLNGHLDVIPGKKEQYTPYVEGDKLYGVGSMDMKANVACLVDVFRTVASEVEYPIALQMVTDEEIGGFHGTKHQVEQGIRADFVLAAEPTNFDIVHKAKGVLWLEVTATGETAHGAYPWRGKNAIWMMHEFLNLVEQTFPIPQTEVWETTVNVSSLDTENTVLNKVPDVCTVKLDVRYIAEDSDTIVERIEKILPEGFTMRVLAKEPSLLTEETDFFVMKLKDSASSSLQRNITLRGANGTSDARHYATTQCGGVEFGPVGDGIGSDNEWVSIESLSQYCAILKHFLRSI